MQIYKIYIYGNLYGISGQRFALFIIKVALITVLSNYTMSYKPTSDYNAAFHVFTYAADGLYVQFKKRDQALT